jgi:dynein heavy chain
MSAAPQSSYLKESANDRLFSKTAPNNFKVGEKRVVGNLDHNNYNRTLKAKKAVHAPGKLGKTTRVPDARPFPGESRQTRKLGNTILMSTDDEMLYAETTKAPVTGSADYTRDPDFLKVDLSKLPIEMFDDLEYEAADKSPAEWLALQTGAQSPFFHNHTWMWRRVDVIGYNPDTKKYIIRFIPDGIEKEVHRLNLKFDKEDHDRFDKRRNKADDGRNDAKQIMRLDHFINCQSKEEIKPIRQSSLKAIHERVIDGLALSVPFPDQGTPLGDLLRNLTGDTIQWYSRTMKKTVLFGKLSGSKMDEKTIARYAELHLPPPPGKPAVPLIGKVPCPSYPFKERQHRIAQIHYSSQAEILEVYRWMYTRWIDQFQQTSFMNCSLSTESLPMPLAQFVRLQKDHLEHTTHLLMEEFRRALLDQFVDSTQDVFDFFQSNMLVFKAGSLYKLFSVVDLQVASFLRQILLESLFSWEKLLDNYCQVSAAPKNASANIGRKTEELFALELQTPLFKCQLKLDEEKVLIEPSADDLEVAFIQAIDRMVSAIRSVTSFDKDTMSLLQLEPRIVLNIGAGDPLYADVDTVIRDVKKKIGTQIQSVMKRPKKLAALYDEYLWLLEQDVDEYLDMFLNTNPPPQFEDFEQEVVKLEDAERAIQELSYTYENLSLVQMDVEEATRALTTRARDIRDGLLRLVMHDAHDMNVNVIRRYNDILDRIGEKPSDEKALADLRVFIEQSKSTVHDISDQYMNVRRSQNLLFKYQIALPMEDVSLSWSTVEYPARIDALGRDVEIKLEEDKIKMMDKLAMEKQVFEHLLERLEQGVKSAKALSDYSQREPYFETVNKLMDEILEAKVQGDNFNMREKVFGFAQTDYVVLDTFLEDLTPFYKLWNMVSDFHNSKNDWLHGEFKDLDGKKIEEDMTDWWKSSYKLAKTLDTDFGEVAACAFKLREETTEFRNHLPVIQSLASKALKHRHWEALSELLGKNIDPQDDLTLNQLLELDAATHIEEILEVTIAAEKEYNLEKTLDNMQKEWESLDFEVKPYKESGTFVVGGIDDIVTLLDDHIVKTQTMRGSPYIRPIEKECKNWEYKLKYAQGLLDAWIACQRTWMYLEPIFGSEDIMRQLPTEARRFNGVDNLWRKTLAETHQDPNFMNQSDPEKRLEEKFVKANEKLEEITKGLNDYLEMKRLYFPRFFFLSNDELLEILSQTKEPRAVQPHLGKCFEGVNKVFFEPDLKISRLISGEGEEIQMDKPVDPETPNNKGNVEKWLLELESTQWDSIRTQTLGSLLEYKNVARRKWILNWPAQAILAVSCIYWTQEVTSALTVGGGADLKACNEKLNAQLKDMVDLVRGKLNKLQRKTLGALTTIDVHNRDVVEHMCDINTSVVSDFSWMSQLRYYWEDAWQDGQAVKKGQKTCVARIVNARCLYGYEYLGNTMRLVITPLTDRCYRTMVGALDLLYGGAPEGPAGTGKTETVKDLSKAMAIHCVVFNCSDGLDYLAMAKFFKGLAGCGSWCCFDEFNRINIEVLSVIAQQILVINQGKREKKEMFHFEGTYMKLNSNCNVFITMNPGYAGRAELPDNLKALFRPCAMMVPDYAMIGEIRLYSFGFEDARENAKKIVAVLQLSSEQLSSQKHYDYGMRAVNSILVAAGNLREQLGNDPEWNESRIVLRSINDVNLAKFLVEDLPLFAGITSDLFPGVTLPQAEYGVLPTALDEVCRDGIEVAPGNTFFLENKVETMTKTIQLYEMVLVRHGVMVVGQTCSGKTSTIHSLAKAMTRAHTHHEAQAAFEKVQIITINPKSVTSGQLYGLFDENTHEFVDGIIAVTFRRLAKDISPDRKWMLLDGPVDAVWIENMNTVLDDNKKLCLMSGEIIKMSDQMTMMFEAEDLEQASPATVSRVGMIFCETRNITWVPVLNIWLNSLTDAVKPHTELIVSLFHWIFPVMSYFGSKFCRQPTKMATQELIFSMCRLMKSLLDFDEGCASDLPKVIEGCFLFSLIWSVGACLDGDGRKKFDQYVRGIMDGTIYETLEYDDFRIKNPEYVCDISRKAVQFFPDTGSVFDYIFDAKTAKWNNWLEGLPTFKIEKDAKFNDIVVPTIDTTRHEWVVEKLLRKGYHVMCTGDTGTGKSVTVKNKLVSGMPANYMSIFLNFSAQTSANQTQDLIDTKLDKRRKGVIGPPLGNTAVVFVDDLNMPAKEIYGAQPPVEILRQWMDHQGWFDRKENSFRQLVDLQFCAAMGPPGGGRTKITQRYVRHFNLINFINFSDESLGRVFGTILDWRLSHGFAGPVKSQSGAMVEATIRVYNTIAASLLPTPAKSHYTFNLRDLSKVFQGVLQGDAKEIGDKESFVKLWVHECMRVFSDRLIDEKDRSWFKDLVGICCKENFNIEFKKLLGPNDNIVYGNFGDNKSLTKPYTDMPDRALLKHVVDGYLEDYNSMSAKQMNLVLFASAIEHVARISRIINQPYGNALLVGVGGSGRKSLTTLSVFIADFDLFSIEITKSYGMADWREDIKSVMNKTGVANKPTVFLMDDTQIVQESFLEDINGILNTGEVANLLNNEEMGAISEALSKPCQDAGINSGSPTDVYNFFISRVRSNLHLVLCLSPIGEAFRTRLRMFPSLVNCCTIDWFTEWPEEALRSVANFFLASVDLDADIKSGVVDACVDMQQRVRSLSVRYLAEMNRNYYVTPTSYLELINTFKNLLSVQRKEVFDGKARYDNGLSKLKETADQVNEMQVYLEDLQPKLVVATQETDALLIVITADRVVATEQSVLVSAEAKLCNQQAADANQLKEECEAGLAEAIPALAAAEKALNALDKSDIVEMKAMKKPSPAIKSVMAACCIMLGVKPDKKMKEGDPRIDPYWVPAVKNLLNDTKFLQRLQGYDRDNMATDVVAKAKEFTDDPEFDPEVLAKKGSAAAAGLGRWVHAMVKYDRVARVVAPKRAALAEAQSTLKEAQDNLSAKEASLKVVTDKVAALEVSLKEAMDKKDSLKAQVIDCENKLRRADALIKGLGGEKTRWTEMSFKLAQQYDNVTGDIVLSAGVIAYLGAFISSYRDDAIQQWASLLQHKGITCSEGFNLRDTLGNAIEIRSWVINRLPNDSFSIENAIMLTKSNRWPLMIDPQGQANKWVKKMEENNSLKVVKQNQSNFVRMVENSIQFGSPVLLENVPEALDPILESVLLKQIIIAGGVATIRLGDSTIEYDKNFRLYITTKLTNPHYPPELCVKVNLLNFMATAEGLQDQMLGRVVAMEQQELELQRQQLVVEDAENQRQLKEIEDKILFLLKNAEGNILDDEVLIDTLGDSKKTSNIIQEKVKIAENTQVRIQKVRQGYVPIAFQSSQLFFCIADLAGVDPMYQYSLDWYISLYEDAIIQAPKSTNLEERLQHLKDTFTLILYTNVCRSLFEKDKLLFSFLLTSRIQLGQNRMDEGELRFFLQGSTSMDLAEPNPYVAWLSDKSWNDILSLASMPKFKDFLAQFKSQGKFWEGVVGTSVPMDTIDAIVADAYDPFQKLCILRCLRPDAVIPATQQFIANDMGTHFIEPPPFDMQSCYNDSKCTTPLIFVLTPGADPMEKLLKLAEDLGFSGNKLFAISLGQGQGPIAENAILDAGDKGSWVCLQNCHLCISWMPTLEKICEEFSEETLHPNFRLWLTSEPSPAFPAFVLQNGVKMTNEPPKGMRANLLGSFLAMDSAWFEGCNRSNEFKKILFGLCYFHAAVRERRKFGPLGWNIQYVFSGPDLKISMDQLRIFLDDLEPTEVVPYAALAYLVGECNYGGRVTDDKDRRCILNVLADFYTPQICDDEYKFSPSGTYYAPAAGSMEDFRNYVRDLPYNEGPEVFGLHENANISCAIAETNLLLDTALSLQPRAAGGAGKSWGDSLQELAADIAERVPPLYDIEKALIMFPVKYDESMNTVLTQELLRFNNLILAIKVSLVDVQKAIKGLVVMSAELEQMGNSMVLGKVPHMWSSVGYPSLKPLGAWVTDFLDRLKFLGEWFESGKSPNVYWVSGFFFTQAFITGTLQNYARKYSRPIDKVEFDFRVLTANEMEMSTTLKPKDGAYIKGLFMEGARWDAEQHVIAESHPRELFVQMPTLHLNPGDKTSIPVVRGIPEQYTGSLDGTALVYMCPVYKTSFRQGTLSTTGHSTNFVMFIRIPMSEEHVQQHWIKRGVAMLTQLDN